MLYILRICRSYFIIKIFVNKTRINKNKKKGHFPSLHSFEQQLNPSARFHPPLHLVPFGSQAKHVPLPHFACLHDKPGSQSSLSALHFSFIFLASLNLNNKVLFDIIRFVTTFFLGIRGFRDL
ncbi:hypothetical protein Mgra_00005172 [Meloidogyne graminicola]|uniref:Uncharacterized protein n=1 Tax=Meloidogyne graminicola TaxID=189291 RepID=A0A8S9ZQD1_9BILA|nr:hypothetical protein Mgra_00005172 [Meloidogyne graminicola]